MKGISHFVIGAGAGFASASMLGADTEATGIMIGIGAVSALVPDLDTGGLLSNRLTLSHKGIKRLTVFIGLLLFLYSMWNLSGTERLIGLAVGAGIIAFSSVINKKFMLLVTSAAVLVIGFYTGEIWIILSGIYLLAASFMAHRSYTHSLLGLLYFYILAGYFERETMLFGTQLAATLGYASHLLADSKIFPVNKKGIKLLLPILKKDF